MLAMPWCTNEEVYYSTRDVYEDNIEIRRKVKEYDYLIWYIWIPGFKKHIADPTYGFSYPPVVFPEDIRILLWDDNARFQLVTVGHRKSHPERLLVIECRTGTYEYPININAIGYTIPGYSPIPFIYGKSIVFFMFNARVENECGENYGLIVVDLPLSKTTKTLTAYRENSVEFKKIVSYLSANYRWDKSREYDFCERYRWLPYVRFYEKYFRPCPGREKFEYSKKGFWDEYDKGCRGKNR